MPSPHSTADLHVEDVSRHFGRRWALARVSFDLPAGASLLLLGANGSGKTTLLRTLATAIAPHRGTVRWGGQDLWQHRHALRPRIALLSHASGLYADLTGRENLQVWAAMAGLPTSVDRFLDRVGLLQHAERPVRTYSAGMTRRLALARLLLKTPTLALLDEPFSALDPSGRQVVHEVVSELRSQGASLILSTHHPGLAATLCDSALRLESGQIVWRGAPDSPQAVVGEA